MSIDIVISDNADEAGKLIADEIATVIRRKPNAVIGVATGSSPLPIYRALADKVSSGLNATEVSWFALDEYLGLPPRSEQSYRYFLERHLIAPLGLDPKRLHVPDPSDADPDRAAQRYETEILQAQVDLQILGIGRNGHIGFNEPGTPFSIPTHRASLSETTRKANARFFHDSSEVPRECLTQGLGTIMRARRIELIATGPTKADAIARATAPPADPKCPASILQRHNSVRFVLDPLAAAKLT